MPNCSELNIEDRCRFIELIAKHKVHCHFEGDELVVPSGQGRNVKLYVFGAMDGFKLALNMYRNINYQMGLFENGTCNSDD